jgi:hypothetical protein
MPQVDFYDRDERLLDIRWGDAPIPRAGETFMVNHKDPNIPVQHWVVDRVEWTYAPAFVKSLPGRKYGQSISAYVTIGVYLTPKY